METTIKDRRSHTRIEFDAGAVVISNNKPYQVVIHDISLKGALINKPVNCHIPVETRCVLKLELSEQEPITMGTIVKRADNEYIGMECESIDLDSIARLRRLVELNLANESLLERELEALLQPVTA